MHTSNQQEVTSLHMGHKIANSALTSWRVEWSKWREYFQVYLPASEIKYKGEWIWMTAMSSHGQADKDEPTTMLLSREKNTYSSTLKK